MLMDQTPIINSIVTISRLSIGDNHSLSILSIWWVIEEIAFLIKSKMRILTKLSRYNRKSKLIMNTLFLHLLGQLLQHRWLMFSLLLRQHRLVLGWSYQTLALIEKLVCHMVSNKHPMVSKVLTLIEPLIHSPAKLIQEWPVVISTLILMGLSLKLWINRWVWTIKCSLIQELALIINREVKCTQGLRLLQI